MGYAPHFYNPFVHGNAPYHGIEAGMVMWEKIAKNVAENQDGPMIIGEWGIWQEDSNMNREFIRNVIKMADRSASGWAFWRLGAGFTSRAKWCREVAN